MENEKKFLRGRITQKVICHQCQKEFDKPVTDIKQNIKFNRKMFCSKICSGRYTGTLSRGKRKGNMESIYRAHDTYMEKFKRDPFLSPFNYLIGQARHRYHDFLLNYQILFDQWDKQKGKCIYTGIELKLPTHKIKHHRIYQASLDRIDSSKGYIEGNVHFVSAAINMMKGNMTHDDTVAMIKLIKAIS